MSGMRLGNRGAVLGTLRIASIACLVLASGLPVLAEDYEAPLTLPPNAGIELTIARSASGYGAGDMAGKVITFRYRQDIAPAGDGYRVHQQRTGTDFPDGMDAAERARLERALASTDDVTYEADGSLTPMRIRDWQAYVESMMKGAAADAKDEAAIQATRASFRRLTPEQGASLLREQGMVAVPQNAVLNLGAPRSGTSQSLNPLGGGPIQNSMSVELESIDRSGKTATIHYRRILDPESASRSVRESLLSLADRLPPGTRRPSPEELADFKLENTLDCRYQMDMKTGLAVQTECISTVSNIDRSLQRTSRADRWVITQRLVP